MEIGYVVGLFGEEIEFLVGDANLIRIFGLCKGLTQKKILNDERR